MQREIKYRGKVKYNGNYLFAGDWAYGSLIIKSKGTFIYVIEEDEFGNIVRELEVEVFPESVGQYTGMKDRDGKEAYSFDIVNVTNKGTYNGNKVIVWDEILLCYVLVWAELFQGWVNSSSGTTYLKVSSGIKCEIIGNTIDNPELIKP